MANCCEGSSGLIKINAGVPGSKGERGSQFRVGDSLPTLPSPDIKDGDIFFNTANGKSSILKEGGFVEFSFFLIGGEFSGHEEASLSGVQVGGIYTLSEVNDFGLPQGVLIALQPNF